MIVRKPFIRRSSGSTVLAVAGLSLLVAFLVGGTALLISLGMATYYQDKLAFVTIQAAEWACGELSFGGMLRPGAGQVNVTPVVDDLLTSMGIPKASSVEVQSDGDQVSVTVAVQGLAMPTGGGILPAFIALKDTEVKRFDEDRPPYVLRVGIAGRRETEVAIPSYGFFQHFYKNYSDTTLGYHDLRNPFFYRGRRVYSNVWTGMATGAKYGVWRPASAGL